MRMAGQGETAVALDGERVTVPGRDRHPAFCIEIDCGRALKHDWDLGLELDEAAESGGRKLASPPTKLHFFTLSPTLEEAITRVKRFPPRKWEITNEVNDLAYFPEVA